MKLSYVKLSLAEAAIIEHLLETISKNNTIEQNAQYLSGQLEQIEILNNNFTQLKTEELDCIIVENLPIITNLDLAKTLSFAMSLMIGETFQYLQQNDGEVTAEVKPLAGYEHTISSGGKVLLGWHTDDCMIAKDSRAYWIQLSGFYNPDNICTNIAFIDDIVPMLSETTLQILMNQPYYLIIPASFRVEKIWTEVCPIISINSSGKYEIGVSAYNDIKCPNQESHDALHELMEVSSKCKHSINLQPGNAIFFNNNRLLHSRDPIHSERLVLRTYMIESLAGLRSRTETTEGRVFDLKHLIME